MYFISSNVNKMPARENSPIKMLKQWPFAILLNKNQPRLF